MLQEDKFGGVKEGLGYSAVPPPPAQIYSSPKKDLSWTGLPEFKDDTVTDYSRPAPTIESSPNDAQNKNSSVTEEASPSTILPKSFIKFVKANDSPTKSKIDKAKKSPVKSMPPRPSIHRPYRPPMRPIKPNMNTAQPKRTSFYKPTHSYNKRPFQETTQNLVAILIQRVKRLDRELKARTLIQKVDRGRPRPVMAWVPKKV
nr:hypothetical protein [Tanacetum cinerariifolium]